MYFHAHSHHRGFSLSQPDHLQTEITYVQETRQNIGSKSEVNLVFKSVSKIPPFSFLRNKLNPLSSKIILMFPCSYRAVYVSETCRSINTNVVLHSEVAENQHDTSHQIIFDCIFVSVNFVNYYSKEIQQVLLIIYQY